MRLADHPIPPSLAGWIERISRLELAADERMPIFAGARVHLFFCERGGATLRGADASVFAGEAVCWGPFETAAQIQACPAGARGWLVKCRGGAGPSIIGGSTEAITGVVMPLGACWPHLSREAFASSPAVALPRIHRDIRQAIGRGEDHLVWSPGQCGHVMEMLDRMPVVEVSDRLGVSKATFERRIRAAFGLTPKRLARIQRLYRGLALPDSSDAGLASRLGYSDQSHFIADFRELTGMTPGAFRRQGGGSPDFLSLYDAVDRSHAG